MGPEEVAKETIEEKKKQHITETIAAFAILVISLSAIGFGAWYYLGNQSEGSYLSQRVFKKETTKSTETTTNQTTPSKSPKEVVTEYVNLNKEDTLSSTDIITKTKGLVVDVFNFQSFGNAAPLGIQDLVPNDFSPTTLTEKIGNDGTAYVLMRGMWSGETDFSREFMLVKINNEWKIASIKQYSPWPPEAN